MHPCAEQTRMLSSGCVSGWMYAPAATNRTAGSRNREMLR
jgi:hypothetical protein